MSDNNYKNDILRPKSTKLGTIVGAKLVKLKVIAHFFLKNEQRSPYVYIKIFTKTSQKYMIAV